VKTILLGIWYSITVRLAFLFFLVGGCGFLLVLTLFKVYTERASDVSSYPLPFISYLTQQLEAVEQPSAKQALMDDTLYGVRVEGLLSTWQSKTEMPALDELTFDQPLSESTGYYTAANGARYLVIERGDNYYIYAHRFEGEEDDAYQLAIVFIPIITLMVCFLAYFIGRRFITPITWIREGVLQIGEGDLSYRIPYKRQDELGQLVAIINQMTEDLEQIFDSKRQLLLAISHELRSPLTRMKLNVALLDATPGADRLSGDIDQMKEIIEGLLDSESLQGAHTALEKEPVELGGLISAIVEEYPDSSDDPDGKSGGGVFFHHEGPSIELMLDVARIKFLIRNLINNALKYTEEDGRHIDVQLNTVDEEISVSVTDNGIGIDDQHKAHIFSPFYRADQSRGRKTGGVGLGLYLCKLIVLAHGGNIFVQSSAGQGSCFWVTLPTKRL
jgi:signal transduction histidine kinase